MTDGPRPGGPKPGGPKPPDPRPPKQADRIRALMATPLIQGAPPLSAAQRDRIASVFALAHRSRSRRVLAA